jgi:hypothetical protein
MKTNIKGTDKGFIALFIIGLVFAASITQAQESVPAPTPPSSLTQTATDIYNGVKGLLPSNLGSITNWAIAPYVTYAPKAPAGNSIGGGIFGMYNLNVTGDHVAVGLAVDYLGQFSLISGQCALKTTTHPLAYVPILKDYQWARDLEDTPFVLGGVAKPLSGTGNNVGSVVVVADAGNQIQFGHFQGGRFGAGIVWGKWLNAGDYSMARYHLFLSWQKGF